MTLELGITSPVLNCLYVCMQCIHNIDHEDRPEDLVGTVYIVLGVR